MKKLTLLLALLFALLFALLMAPKSIQAQEDSRHFVALSDLIRAETVYNLCSADDGDDAAYQVCVSFIFGWIGGTYISAVQSTILAAQSDMGMEEAHQIVLETLNICLPRYGTADTLRNVFLQYYEDNPSYRSEPAYLVFTLASLKQFPCS